MTAFAEPTVRIRLPPAVSQVRTCLSREFPFLRREAAVFRGCAGRGERCGRQRRAGRGNIGPTGGNISVGPYSVPHRRPYSPGATSFSLRKLLTEFSD